MHIVQASTQIPEPWETGRTRKLLPDYNQKILTFHPIYDYFALLTAFNTNTTFNFHQYLKDNYLLIIKPKNVTCTKLFSYGTAYEVCFKLHFQVFIQKQITSQLLASKFLKMFTMYVVFVQVCLAQVVQHGCEFFAKCQWGRSSLPLITQVVEDGYEFFA